jgi:hypothetical protein
VGSYAYERGE